MAHAAQLKVDKLRLTEQKPTKGKCSRNAANDKGSGSHSTGPLFDRAERTKSPGWMQDCKLFIVHMPWLGEEKIKALSSFNGCGVNRFGSVLGQERQKEASSLLF